MVTHKLLKNNGAFAFCVVFVAIFCFRVGESEEGTATSREIYGSLLHQVFLALQKVLEFFETGFFEVNMDGVYGVRMCQGSLIGALEDCTRYKNRCNQTLMNAIQDVIDRFNYFAENALPNVQEQDDVYYNIFLPAISAPSNIEYIPDRLVGIDEILNMSLEYNGQLGNHCFGSIMGTLKIQGSIVPACTISEECWQFMSVKGTVGYFTTHQLLYCMYGEQVGCKKVLEDFIQKKLNISLRQHKKFLCEQIFIDASFREENGKVDIQAEDLFLEQIAVCGMLGFEDFMSLKWMRMILKWQTQRGCFTTLPFMEISEDISKNRYISKRLYMHLTKERDKMSQATKNSIKERIDNLEQEYHRLQVIAYVQTFDYGVSTGSFPNRKLLSEQVMGGDCLSHKTGLGAATLGVYVRFLVGKLHN